MSREQDSVAVLHIDRLAAIRYREAIARKNAHHPDERTQCEERIAALDAAIAALTREAAPQASGGDDVLVAHLKGIAAHIRAVPKYSNLRGDADYIDAAIRRLATTDSAIQSQQGATGGAVLDDAMVERAAIAWRDYVGHTAENRRMRAALEAALAHPQAAGSEWSPAQVGDRALGRNRGYPQAAGSAPGEVKPTALIGFPEDKPIPGYDLIYPGTAKLPGFKYRPIWSMENHPDARRQRDKAPATAAGSAPVGVDANDAARYRWLRDGGTEALCVRVHGNNPIHTHLWGYYLKCGTKLDAAIDAALEKERAE